VAPLGDDALQPHDARLPEHDRAIDVLDVLAQPDPKLGPGQELHQQGAAPCPIGVATENWSARMGGA
jgi:hypothetical protein